MDLNLVSLLITPVQQVGLNLHQLTNTLVGVIQAWTHEAEARKKAYEALSELPETLVALVNHQQEVSKERHEDLLAALRGNRLDLDPVVAALKGQSGLTVAAIQSIATAAAQQEARRLARVGQKQAPSAPNRPVKGPRRPFNPPRIPEGASQVTPAAPEKDLNWAKDSPTT